MTPIHDSSSVVNNILEKLNSYDKDLSVLNTKLENLQSILGQQQDFQSEMKLKQIVKSAFINLDSSYNSGATLLNELKATCYKIYKNIEEADQLLKELDILKDEISNDQLEPFMKVLAKSKVIIYMRAQMLIHKNNNPENNLLIDNLIKLDKLYVKKYGVESASEIISQTREIIGMLNNLVDLNETFFGDIKTKSKEIESALINKITESAEEQFKIISIPQGEFLVNKEHSYKILESNRNYNSLINTMQNLSNQRSEILKTASKGQEMYLQNEYETLRTLNKDGDVMGIQKSPHLIFQYTDKADPEKKHGYLTHKYSKDLTETDIRLKFNLLPAKNACNQLLQGLSYTHGHQFVHKDIKPANIYRESIKDQDVFVLGDWGSAKQTSNSDEFFNKLIETVQRLKSTSNVDPIKHALLIGSTSKYFPNSEDAVALLQRGSELKEAIDAKSKDKSEEDQQLQKELDDIKSSLIMFMQRADIYALGLSLAETLAGEFLEDPATQEHIEELLKSIHLTEMIPLLTAMTHVDYMQRPSANEALALLNKINPS